MKYNLHMYWCLFAPLTIPIHGFSSLKEMVDYINTHDEMVAPDNQDYINPDYLSSYSLRLPSWHQKLGAFFSKHNTFHNTISECTSILTSLVHYREIRGFNHRHIVQLHHNPDDILIVWGDLQGALHSFVRALVELEKEGIINNDLTIIKPNHCLIFNGNITGQTDNCLELIECICTLMLKNPDRVLCTSGPLEDHNVWTDHGLFSEISALTGIRGTKFGVPYRMQIAENMIDLLTRFFNTLPIAVYIDYPPADSAQPHNLIRISGFGADSPELDTRNFDDFFNKKEDRYVIHEPLSIYRLSNIIPTSNPAIVRVFITSIPGFVHFTATEGLIQLEPIDGSLVWAIFSAPNAFQRKINKFYFDAFVKINLKKDFNEATIELIHRDARTKEPFHKEEKYLLASGIDIMQHQDTDAHTMAVTVLGASLDLSKSAGNIGTNLRHGVLAALKDGQENIQPDARRIRVAFFDDKLSSYIASINLQEIQKTYKLPIITFPITEQVMSNYLDKLKTDSLLALFPISGSTELHSANYPGVIFFRPSYKQEVKSLINDELLQSQDGHFCFFYQDDKFGRNALEVARTEMTRRGHKWIEISHLPNETDFTQQVQEFKKHNFTAIFFLSLGLTVREFIQQLGAQKLIQLNLYGISMLGGQAFKHFLDELGLSITISQVVPNPEASKLPIVQEYRASMDSRNIPYSVFSLEGYICGALLVEAITHIKKPITKETIIEYFTSFKNYNFKGLLLTFNPEYRDLSQTVWLEQGNPEWKVYRGESVI